MTHRAETIVATFQTRLTGLSTAGANVFRGRGYALAAGELPAIKIELGPDTKLRDLAPDLQDWQLTVYTTYVAKSASTQVDTELNQLRAESTVALQADYKLGLAFVLDTTEGDVEDPQISNEGEQPAASMRQAWHVQYRRSRTDPGA